MQSGLIIMHDFAQSCIDRHVKPVTELEQSLNSTEILKSPFPIEPEIKRNTAEVPASNIFVMTSNPSLLQTILQLLREFAVPITILENAFEAQRSDTLNCGLVIIDTDLPGGGGPSVWRWLSGKNRALTAIFVSTRRDVALAVQCMKDGAENFFAEPIAPGELKAGIQSALMAQAGREVESAREAARQNIINGLTPAERIVADLMAEGLFTKQIAARIGRSENTVKIHRARILRKAGVPSAACFVRLLAGERGPAFQDLVR